MNKTTTGDRTRAERAFEAMTPELREKCEAMRLLMGAGRRQDALARRELGQLVNEVRAAPDRYGSEGVKQLSRALGFKGETSLYPYGAVAAVWTSEELTGLLSRHGVTGLPLSISHLVAIAAAEGAAAQAGLVEAVLAEGLSVRDLKRPILKPARPATVRRASSTTAALHGLSATSRVLLRRLDHWEERVLPRLEREALLDRGPLRLAALEQNRLLERLTTMVARLRAVAGDPEEAGHAEHRGGRDATAN